MAECNFWKLKVQWFPSPLYKKSTLNLQKIVNGGMTESYTTSVQALFAVLIGM